MATGLEKEDGAVADDRALGDSWSAAAAAVAVIAAVGPAESSRAPTCAVDSTAVSAHRATRPACR